MEDTKVIVNSAKFFKRDDTKILAILVAMKAPSVITGMQQKKDTVLGERINLLEQRCYFFLNSDTMDSFSSFPIFLTIERLLIFRTMFFSFGSRGTLWTRDLLLVESRLR
jgi:hypothetical protein